jgi:steroid 5-alpha reductase family enzyme
MVPAAEEIGGRKARDARADDGDPFHLRYGSVPSLVTLAGVGWILSAIALALLWGWHLRLKNAGIVDAGWAGLVGGLAIFYAAAGHGMTGRRMAIGSMMGSWGARLAVYLLYDRVLGRPEDGRYAELRRARGAAADTWFFWFFQAQAFAAVFFSLPALLSVNNPARSFAGIEYLAAALWAAAFSGETTADRQLLQFKSDPANRGTTCRIGLWRYSRHPNYFFEWLIWVAYALFAAGSPRGWIALACPAAMLYLLFRVTGIPATEAQALRSRGEEYRRYQRATSAFVPWFPRGEPDEPA